MKTTFALFVLLTLISCDKTPVEKPVDNNQTEEIKNNIILADYVVKP